jgi:uncharacterized protein (DUF1697 family)
MKTYIALLRGVNVGGNKKVAMADLREVCAELGLANARTLLQSGNIVFTSEPRRTKDLESLLERETERRLGLATRFFVRTDDEWADVVESNPFSDAAERDPSHLLVLFLSDTPAAGHLDAMQDAIVGREVVAGHGRHVYAVYPDGIGRSKLTNAVLERALGGPCTGRNWNTVLKLANMVA